MKKKVFIFMLMVVLGIGFCFAQDTLVRWTFPTGTASDSLPDMSLAMNSSYTIRAVGGTSVINYTTNGNPTYSAQATGWDGGTGTKYWSIRFKTTGFINLKLSAQIRSGGTYAGPKDFKVQYRPYMAVTWTDVPGSNITTANNWTNGTLTNLNLPAALNNQSTVIEVRFVMRTDTSTSGALILSTGISKIDNIVITGGLSIGMETLGASLESLVYPNPNHGKFSLVIPGIGEFNKVEVFSSPGQKILEENINMGENIKNLGLTDRKGLYLLRLSGSDHIKVLKIIVN